MITLFLNYVLPFLVLILIISAAALRVHWRGGPGAWLFAFFLVAFGPSLLYALIADDSSGALFGISILAAFITTGLLVWRQTKK